LLESLFGLLSGILLIALGVFGQRFTVGLSGRTRVSPWYGRTWLIGNGFFLLVAGASGLLYSTHAQSLMIGRVAPGFWERGKQLFYGVIESYNGLGMAAFGLIASVYFFREQKWVWFALGLAFATACALMGYDGVRTLVRGY
jgi:hypothetical protein